MREHSGLRIGIRLDRVDDPTAAVALAVDAERLGFDVVVVPEQADGWDAWTLLSWIAARTERIGLVAAELDPRRSPTVLARASAGLDLLAGGRVALALAAGTDGRAADDTVTVLRRMRDVGAPPVQHAGAHRIAGAAPGPLPAHDIPVWLSGDDPAAIELAGRTADGWVGGLDGEGPGQLVERLRLLDQHARAAGRDPRELQRGVVLDGRHDPDGADLERLVAEHGVGTVVLAVDARSAPAELERFAREVAPRLRDAAEKALADGVLPGRPLRRADVRARRRPGIDYDGLPGSLADTAVEPGDAGYAAVRSTYLRGGRPGLVLRPRTPDEVADAIAVARRHRHLPLGIRSGGHGISGRSTNDGGLVIDVGALNRIEVLDEGRRLVRIGPGARWKEVATALAPHGWALTSGDYGGVGVGGLATAGGIGYLGRKQGLTIDHLRAAELVLADGSRVRASETEHPELFWAVRGAGANFGIVTAFEFEVDEVPGVGWADLAFRVDDPARFLVDFGRVTAAAPRETTANLVMGRSGVARVMAMVASDDPDVVVAQLQPFADIAPLVQQQVVMAPYAAVMNMFPDTPHQGMGEPVSRSGLAPALTPEFAEASARLLAGDEVYFFQLRSMGGAIADVPPDATAFGHREAAASVVAMGANAQHLDREWAVLQPRLRGSYLSFETRTGPDRVAEAFPPATLARLRALKAQLDPTTFFRDNFAVAPTTPGSSA